MSKKITKPKTKLQEILISRGMSQKELFQLIQDENDGQKVQMYILNEIINGKRRNYNINTAILISNALNIAIDDMLE
jgi:transcriptional regulator with XRE-family HTH domain